MATDKATASHLFTIPQVNNPKQTGSTGTDGLVDWFYWDRRVSGLLSVTSVLGALERLQTKLVQREEWSHSGAVGTLRQTLQSPLLSHILTLQQSIRQLRNQLTLMPPDSCDEFSFSSSGQLIMSAVSASSRPAVHAVAGSASTLTNGSSPPARQSPPSQEHLQRWILAAAKGRHTELVRLTRPVSGGLGFSVVGLSPTGGGSSQGVFVKQVQPGGVAHRVRERDQILAINGVPLEAGVSQPQALALLQQPGELVELVVARERPLRTVSRRFSSVASQNASFHSLSLSWRPVPTEAIFNGEVEQSSTPAPWRSTGVVVRTLVPNSVADRDGRLRTGDHILRIGATPTSGLTSDQVVKVLQECGSHVTMLVAREPRGSHLAVPRTPPPPSSAPVSTLPPRQPDPPPQRRPSRTIHEVPLVKKDGQSLGISIIGHNPLSSQDAVGVFVKHVVPGSAADQSGNIRIQDRLIALDGVSLHGLTNQEVVKVMKRTGQTVVLTLVRKKTRGPERSLDKGGGSTKAPVCWTTIKTAKKRNVEVESDELRLLAVTLTWFFASADWSEREAAGAQLRAKWEAALGPKYQLLVVNLDPVIDDDAELQKYSKVRRLLRVWAALSWTPSTGNHYVSSHGVLRPEDELLEVNGVQLYGKSRREVVSFLKEAPPPFTLVCCRRPDL
uniref:InaD-like n=1 Tax=Tetraodon nigroviridis TaxID=99883 RepID=H3CK11_TETNG